MTKGHSVKPWQARIHESSPHLDPFLWPDSLVATHMEEEITELRAALKAKAAPAPVQPQQPELTVWYGPMPESNGKSNFTAILMRKGDGMIEAMSSGMTIARSEYPERVRYEADCVRFLIGDLNEEPCILDYDTDKHSGYVAPAGQTNQSEQGRQDE